MNDYVKFAIIALIGVVIGFLIVWAHIKIDRMAYYLEEQEISNQMMDEELFDLDVQIYQEVMDLKYILVESYVQDGEVTLAEYDYIYGLWKDSIDQYAESMGLRASLNVIIDAWLIDHQFVNPDLVPLEEDGPVEPCEQ